jgi:hypothetical protein
MIGATPLIALLTTATGWAQHASMPAGMTHEEHLSQMQKASALKRRGAVAMGFDQDATTHHFGLTPNGGFIQVQANDSADATNVAAIRSHLRAIADAFAAGDFSSPVMTHEETPPGVPDMQRLTAAITFRFVETERGGRVQIATTSAAALSAVHDFLRYQIKEHGTGDSLAVQRR